MVTLKERTSGLSFLSVDVILNEVFEVVGTGSEDPQVYTVKRGPKKVGRWRSSHLGRVD